MCVSLFFLDQHEHYTRDILRPGLSITRENVDNFLKKEKENVDKPPESERIMCWVDMYITVHTFFFGMQNYECIKNEMRLINL